MQFVAKSVSDDMRRSASFLLFFVIELLHIIDDMLTLNSIIK
jgi:hypothetical protein